MHANTIEVQNVITNLINFKHCTPTEDPGAQLIAEAIAAFHENNRCIRQTGQRIIPAKVFAGIILIVKVVPDLRSELDWQCR